MVAPTEFDPVPDNNTTIGGYNVAEGCAAANIDNALRYIAAVIRVTFNGIPVTSSFVTATGGVFLNQPIYQGRGALLHQNDPNNASGRIFVVADGTVPSGLANGDIVIGV